MSPTPSNMPAPTPTEDRISLRHYWHVTLERRWLALSSFFTVFVLCLVYLFNATPIYQASTRVQIDRESDNVLNIKEVFSIDAREQDYLQTQYKNLQSRTLIEAVIKKLKLDKDPGFSKAPDLVRAVSEGVTIAPIRLSRLVDIKVSNADPSKAAQIANALADTFIQDNLNQKMTKSLEALRWLKNEADALERDVEQADLALQKYRVDKRMVSLEQSENIVQQGLKQIQAELDRARSDAATSQRMLEEVQHLLDSGMSVDSVPQVARDPVIMEMRKTLADREALLANLLKRYKDKWPDVIRAREEIASLRGSIRSQADRVYTTLKAEADLARARETSMRGELAKKEQESFELSQLRIQYDVLNRKAEQSKLLYNIVLGRMKETDLTSKDRTQNMRVVDKAVPPLAPVKPRKALTLLGGVMGGLLIAIGLAFFANYVDDSVKSQDDIETYLRLPFLGYIPNIKTNSVTQRDLHAHVSPQSNAAEGFRTLRATLALMPQSDRLRVLSVTSTIPSEGKSLIASNLAIVLAQTGLRTLLVDSDLRRPSVHKAFGLQSPVGLASYLQGAVSSVDGILHHTDVPNLDVVCCGAVPGSPSELSASKRMAEFIREVRGRYERIVLDCAPVSAVADPLVVASLADGVLFVTKFNKIRRDHARKTVQRIQDAGIRILGCVLNDIDFEGRDSYYYSYYYYQNRYYASHYGTKPRKGGSEAGAERELPEESHKG